MDVVAERSHCGLGREAALAVAARAERREGARVLCTVADGIFFGEDGIGTVFENAAGTGEHLEPDQRLRLRSDLLIACSAGSLPTQCVDISLCRQGAAGQSLTSAAEPRLLVSQRQGVI